MFAMNKLKSIIEVAWDDRNNLSAQTKGETRNAIERTLELLDSGKERVAEKSNGTWVVNQWLKKAVLLSFRIYEMASITGGPNNAMWYSR